MFNFFNKLRARQFHLNSFNYTLIIFNYILSEGYCFILFGIYFKLHCCIGQEYSEIMTHKESSNGWEGKINIC